MKRAKEEKEGKSESVLHKSLAGRLANILPFLTLILCLGGWSIGFYALQEAGPGIVSEDLRCVTFFGGLAVAALLGALAGAFLRRLIWKALYKRVTGRKDELS
jgi:hypothetical protein